VAATVTTRLLIVDDHAAFRSAARALLDRDGFAVVGEAENGVEALRLTQELRPDVLVLDVGLPDIDGFEVAAGLTRDDSHDVRVVLVSNRVFSGCSSAIAESGAVGFLPKHELSGAALRVLLDGDSQHVR
jgi:DNA-binding NarL/FixJ family response regulator